MKRLGGLLLAAMMVLFAAPAFGDVVIDFGTGLAGVGGTFTLLGGNNASGTMIPIGSVTITGAPSNNGVYTVSGTCGTGSAFGCLAFNTSTNTISITGDVSGLGVASTTLLTGSFVSWTANANGISNAIGPDTKATTLLSALGVTSPPYNFSYFGFSTTTSASGSTIISTDFRNTGVVPEPITGGLFGIGLVAVVAFLRRKKL